MLNVDIVVGKIDKKKSFNDYWLELAKIEEGQGWKVFEVLPKLALVLGTPFSHSEENSTFKIPKNPKFEN